MKKNNLVPNKGLSLSQAQSISNLCNQRATEIGAKLMVVNNFSKTVKVSKEDKILVAGHPLPTNVTDLLLEKAGLHACQAFLMENIKAKDALLNQARQIRADVSSVVIPPKPVFVSLIEGTLGEVNENWGWEQLSTAEINEYLQAESFAAHIGQFIHRDGILAGLRRELPNIPAIDWMTIKDGVKSPITITKHHTAEQLLKMHEDLATKHREYEQRVNYYKAKVKNLVTAENARIAKHNADLQNAATQTNSSLQAAYETALGKASGEETTIRGEFEKERQATIATIASMRIDVDPRYQAIVDTFLKTLPKSQD